MKTIATAAMTAINAGEAIVTGAVEILARSAVPDVIATGTAIELDWQQATFDQTLGSGGPNDQARMGLAYFDASGVQIGSTVWATMIDTPINVWTARNVAGTTPAGCAIVRAYMEMNRQTGTNNDGYVDDIVLTIGGVAVPLNNPGGEQGTSGWTNEAGGIGFRGGTTPTPHSGSYFFDGGTSALSRAYQDYAAYTGTAPLRVWGGYGDLTIAGDVYRGIGGRGFAQRTAGALAGVAQGLTLGVSGIEAAALELLDGDEIRAASVVVRRLIFAADGKTLLDAHVFDRGRVDAVNSDETIGGTADISVAMESAARGLGRSGARMRSDSDQRLISPSDGYYKNTAYAGQKDLYWGGTRPVRSGSAGGAGPVAGTIGGTGANF